jgi:hypothetical protein
VRRAELDRWLGQGPLQHPIAQGIGQRRGRARPRQIIQPGQPLLGVAASPGDHRRLGAAHPRGDLLARHPVGGQQHDPRPLDLPGRRALAPRPPLQLPTIGLRDLNSPHTSGHEKWSTPTRDDIEDQATEYEI